MCTHFAPIFVESTDRLRIGARAVMTDLIGDARIRRHFPALVEAARVVGSVQIRNRATLAGNICNASPAADTAPALLVYGAVVNLVGRGGARSVPLTDFFTGPGSTVLTRGELVESIDLPVPTEPTGARVRPRDAPVAASTWRRSISCCLVTASGEARFAYGAVGAAAVSREDDSGALGRARTATRRAGRRRFDG